MRPGRTLLALRSVFALALLALGVGPAAHAQAPAPAPVQTYSGDVSASMWTINGDTVHLRYMLPEAGARKLSSAGTARPDASAAAAAVGQAVSVSSAGGDCPQMVQSQWVGKVYTLALTPGLYRFEIIFVCPRTDGIALHDGVLFDKSPAHVDYARIEVAGKKPVLEMFTRDRQTIALPAGGAAPNGAGLLRFARAGLAALIGQADRLCVIAGLLLVARRWRDLREIAAALGLGYFVSFALALGGLVTPDAALTGAAMGLLTVLIGANAVRLEATGTTGAPGSRVWRVGSTVVVGLIGAGVLAAAALRGAPAGLAAGGLMAFGAAELWLIGTEPDVRWLVFAPAALFGLIDGMGPARDVAQLQLPSLGLVPAFLGYDLGAIAAAAALAALGMAMLWLLGRRLRSVQKVAVDVGAAALVGLGLFWYLSRLYGRA